MFDLSIFDPTSTHLFPKMITDKCRLNSHHEVSITIYVTSRRIYYYNYHDCPQFTFIMNFWPGNFRFQKKKWNTLLCSGSVVIYTTKNLRIIFTVLSMATFFNCCVIVMKLEFLCYSVQFSRYQAICWYDDPDNYVLMQFIPVQLLELRISFSFQLKPIAFYGLYQHLLQFKMFCQSKRYHT